MSRIFSADEVTVLRPRPLHWFGILLLCVGFVALGAWMLTEPVPGFHRFVAWSSIVFFGACGIVAGLQLVPGSSFLRVSRDGFTIRKLWREQTYLWSEVGGFGVTGFELWHGPFRQDHRGVGFKLTEPTRASANQTLLELNATFSGYECGLPETYGFDQQHLADELEALRQLHSKS